MSSFESRVCGLGAVIGASRSRDVRSSSRSTTHPFLQDFRGTSTRDVRGMSRVTSVEVREGHLSDVGGTRNVRGRPRKRQEYSAPESGVVRR